MAFNIAGIHGEFFDLSDNPDGSLETPFSLVPFTQAKKRYVRALDRDDVINGTSEIDQINGCLGNDIIAGLEDNDYLLGGEGGDVVSGNFGDDFIAGNQNNDMLLGNEGNDILRGGKDDDVLIGGDGNDILVGDYGFDILTGDGGNTVGKDLFVLRTDNDTVTGLTHFVVNALMTDRITDFVAAQGDKIVIPGVNSFANIILETNIDINSNGIMDTAIKVAQSLYVGVVFDVSNLGETDFIFDSQGAQTILAGATRSLLPVPVL
jgi:serralysin